MNTMTLTRAGLAALAACALAAPAHADTITRTTSYEYEAVTGLLKKETREPARPNDCLATQHTYDKFGNVSSSSAASCTGATGHALASASAARTTQRIWSADGRFATTEKNALAQAQTLAFDARFGTTTSRKDANLIETKWTYDGFGRKTRETRPDGTYSTWAYLYCTDAGASCPGAIGGISSASVLVERSFTAAGAVNGPERRTFHDMLGRVLRSQVQGFDGAGAAPTIAEDTEYNARGLVARKTGPYAVGTETPIWTRYTYDAVGRIQLEERPDPVAPDGIATTRTEYLWLFSQRTNAKGQIRRELRNAQGQVIEVLDNAGGVLTNAYDAAGRLVKTTAAGVATTYVYDIRGNRRSMADPTAGLWETEYNVFDEPVWQSDAQKRITTSTYDLLGRLTKRVEADLTSEWSWDKNFSTTTACPKAIGKLCQARSDNGYLRSHSYDSLGRLSSTVTQLDAAATIAQSYDAGTGRLAGLTYPGGFQARYEYTPLGYLKKVSGVVPGNATPVMTHETLAMTSDGRVKQFKYGNGVTTGRTYHSTSKRLTGQMATLTGQSAGNVLSHTYGWDVLGNLDSRSDAASGVIEIFEYDGLNRVAQARAVGGGLSGVVETQALYDARGNLTYKSDVGTYSYDPLRPDRIAGVALTQPAAATVALTGTRKLTYAFDELNAKTVGAQAVAGGNLTYTLSQDAANNRNTVRWESYTSFNMPRELKQANATATTSPTNLPATADRTVSFVYGPEHQRSRQTVQLSGSGTGAYQAGTTYYLNGTDGTDLAYEKEVRTSGLTEQRHYLSAGEHVFGVYVSRSGTLGTQTATATHYLHPDHLGSATVLTNAAGAVVERMAFDPWGKRRNLNGTSDKVDALAGQALDRGYTGHEHIDEVGAVNMNGRVYDPLVGRMLSADPTIPDMGNLQAFNRYAYVMNNPLTTTDPTGFEPRDPSIYAPAFLFPEFSFSGANSTVNSFSEKAWSSGTSWTASSINAGGWGASVMTAAVPNNSAFDSSGSGGMFGLPSFEYVAREVREGINRLPQFASELDAIGLTRELGRGLLDGFVRNNRDRWGGWGYVASLVDGSYVAHDEASANGVFAGAAVNGMALALPGGAPRAARAGKEYVDLASTSRRRHILDGEVRPNGSFSGGHRPGTGFAGKSEFPRNWSDAKIMHYISDVATDPASTSRAGRGGDLFVRGVRDGIEIEVLLRRGDIWTAYPVNVRRNP